MKKHIDITFKRILLLAFFMPIVTFGQVTIDFENPGFTEGQDLTKTVTFSGFTFSINSTQPEDHIQWRSTNVPTGGCFVDNNIDIGAITQWTIERADGTEFKLESILILDLTFGSPSGTISAYRDDIQIGTTVNIDFDGTKIFSPNADFGNIDEFRIQAADINFRIDNLIYTPESQPCVDPGIPSITASSNSICPGSNTILSWTGALNDATLWHIYSGTCGGTLLGTTSGNSFLTPALSSNTTFYVRGEDGVGCVDEATGLCGQVSVTVNSTPAASIITSGTDLEYCVGAPSVTLTAINAGATASYLWSNGDTGISTTSILTTVGNPYTVTATDNGCAATSGAVNLIENALPIVTFAAPADMAIDSGEQTGLSGATPIGGVYSGPGVTDDGNGMTYAFDPDTAGFGIHIITYSITDANGCSGAASDDVEVVACQSVIEVQIDLDQFSTEVGWSLSQGATTLFEVPQGTYTTSNVTVTQTVSIAQEDTYTFNITDTFGDGIQGNTYRILEDGIIIINRTFGSPTDTTTFSQTDNFSVNPAEGCNICLDTATFGAAGWGAILPSLSNEVIIDANYDTSIGGLGSFEACKLTVNAGATLTVAADDYILANTDITINGTLIVAHTGSVVQVDDAAIVTNNGAITVKVNTPDVDTRDFIMSGSPMTTETREGVYAAAHNVQAFDASLFDDNAAVAGQAGVLYNFQSEDLDCWNPATGVLSPGAGYLVFPQTGYTAPGGIFLHDYDQGNLNTGVITYPLLEAADAGSQNANMLSNPYASAIDADIFIGAINPQIDAVYFWEHGAAPDPGIPGPNVANFNMQDVSVYNGVGGLAASGAGTTPNGVISTAQGFGVFASGAGTATFNNSMRLTAGNTTLRAANEDRSRIWLNITSKTYEIGGSTLIGFMDQATAGYDAAYDNYRMGTVVSLFSQIDGDVTNGYSIQGRESFDADMQIQLGFSSLIEENTTYSVSLSDFDGPALESHDAYLVDNVFGTVTNLSKVDYEFTSEEGTFYNRFTLQFVDRNILGTNEVNLNAIVLSPNPTNGVLNIVSPRTLVNNVVVTDIRGRVVSTIVVDGLNTYPLDMSSLGSAVYFVRVTTDAGAITKRVIKK